MNDTKPETRLDAWLDAEIRQCDRAANDFIQTLEREGLHNAHLMYGASSLNATLRREVFLRCKEWIAAKWGIREIQNNLTLLRDKDAPTVLVTYRSSIANGFSFAAIQEIRTEIERIKGGGN